MTCYDGSHDPRDCLLRINDMPSSIEKAEAFRDWLAHQADIERERQLEESWSADPPDVPEGHVALYGYEGQIEATMPIKGRPEVLRRAIPEPLILVDDAALLSPSLRVAEYRRIADDTYERI